jgi:hypothetical protein
LSRWEKEQCEWGHNRHAAHGSKQQQLLSVYVQQIEVAAVPFEEMANNTNTSVMLLATGGFNCLG